MPADQIAKLQSQVERLTALVQGETPTLPDRALLNYEQAAVALHSGTHPAYMSPERYEHALQQAKDAGVTPGKIRERCRDETCEWLQVDERLGQSPVILGKTVKAFTQAQESGALKARHQM